MMMNLCSPNRLKLNRKQTFKVQENEIDENLIQLGFEIFQYLCILISSDQLSDKEAQFNLLINGIF